jgi:signal transduction histidine kinase/PAS domain-containing protein
MQDRESHLAGIVRRLVGAGEMSEERRRSEAEQLAQRLASFPEYNPNPVVETDLDANVTYLNPAAEELFGVKYERGASHPLAKDLGPLLGRLMREGSGVLSREVEVQEATFDQKVVYIPEALVIRIYSHEITRIKASEQAMRVAGEEMRKMAQEHELLGEIGRIISSSLDMDEVYAGFGDKLRTLVQFDRLAISLVNLDDNTFTNAYVLGESVPGRERGDVSSLEGTVTNEAVVSRRARVVQGDLKSLEERYPNLIDYPSVVLAPMIYRGELFGVLNARSSMLNAYTEKDAEIMSRVAAQITPAVANSLLYTDIVRAQDALARSNDDLEQFAYAASHDLQEPLRSVTSYIGLIRDRYADKLDDTAREFIDFAVDGADRMRRLIDDLLEYSRVDMRGRAFEPVDCNRVAETVLGDLGQAIGQCNAAVECSPLPVVSGDELQLARLLQNLISNALKFRDKDRPSVRVWAERQRDEWVFAVQDNGIGIAPEHQQNVFGMFTRLHSMSRYEGTGIGLALCSKIAQRHGGRIWVDSEVGEGSTFRFSIPVAD